MLKEKIIIPDRAVKYILFQRTAYLFVQNNVFLNRFLIRIPFLSYNAYVGLEAFFRKNRIKKLFCEDIEAEYERIKGYLPVKASRVLDIGCGVAGIDVMINRHYADNSPELFLLDRTETAKEVYYGLRPKASFYNSLSVAQEILKINGVKDGRVHIEEVGDDNIILFRGGFDLVVSLISWGFHYPVGVYLDQVYSLMNEGGSLIIDVRRGSNGEEEIRKKFRSVEKIYSAQKHDRLLAVK